LFASLGDTGSSYHNPEHFFKTIKDIDGSDLNPLEQRDADEFLARYFDVIESQIKGTPEEKKIKNIFNGTYNNQMICIDCPHKSERIEEFITVTLQVKNKHSLQESLDSFIEGEILQGDNAYYCDKCERKVTCRRRTCIQKLPNIMIVALKRFEIDYNTMQHSKINERVEFPIELKMDKYTDKDLEKTDLLKEMEEMNWSYEDLTEDKKRVHDFKYPEEYYSYTLRGVVVHMGEANSGHYYSYIRDSRSGEWYEFNDTMVTPFDPEDMDEKAFGGEYGENSKFSRWRSSGLKPYNGYMLLYERNYYIDTDEFMKKVEENEVTEEELHSFFNKRFSRLESLVEPDESNDQEVSEVVSSHNEAIWESKQLFSHSLAKLLYRISDEYSFNREGSNILDSVRQANLQDLEHLPKDKWVSTFHRHALTILYFHTVILRSSTRPFYGEY
jgi:ubiquitin carboxyl-terminal hydrolase 9/24